MNNDCKKQAKTEKKKYLKITSDKKGNKIILKPKTQIIKKLPTEKNGSNTERLFNSRKSTPSIVPLEKSGKLKKKKKLDNKTITNFKEDNKNDKLQLKDFQKYLEQLKNINFNEKKSLNSNENKNLKVFYYKNFNKIVQNLYIQDPSKKFKKTIPKLNLNNMNNSPKETEIYSHRSNKT